jgi:hypothetical protein
MESEDEVKEKKKVIVGNRKAQKRASDSDDDNGKVEVKKPKKQDVASNNLPSVFQDCKIYVTKSCEDADKLKRYIIA